MNKLTIRIMSAFAFISAIFIAIMILPASVRADEPEEYKIWVAGEQVTDLNRNDILGDGKVKYDPKTGVLEFKDALITEGYVGSSARNAGILCEESEGKLTVKGKVSLKNVKTAIYCFNELTLDNAEISFDLVCESGFSTKSIYSDKRIDIIDSKITLSGDYPEDDTNAYKWCTGLEAPDISITGSKSEYSCTGYDMGITIDKDLVIEGGSISIKTVDTCIYGPFVKITGPDTKVKLVSSHGNGMNCFGDITIDDADVSVKCGGYCAMACWSDVEPFLSFPFEIYGSIHLNNAKLDVSAPDGGIMGDCVSVTGSDTYIKTSDIISQGTIEINGGTLEIGEDGNNAIYCMADLIIGKDINKVSCRSTDAAIIAKEISVDPSLVSTPTDLKTGKFIDDLITFKAGDKNVATVVFEKPAPTPTSTPAPRVTATPAPKATATSKPVPSNTPSTSPKQEDPKAQIMDFVKRIYIYVLDREPEEDGAAFWSDELWNFRRTGAEVAQGFIFSPEFENRKTSDKDFVTILYKTFFGRDPEDDGMAFWLEQLKSGTMDRVTVANGFIYSQEWANTCAEYGIRSGGELKPTGAIAPTDLTYAFVERMYTTAMGRSYDEEGRQYWASELANFNVTGEQVGASFFLSDEMNGYNLSDKEFLGRLYVTFMNREADADGEAYWLSQMSAGVARADIVFGFTRSAEFTDKCVEARILPY